MLCKPSFTGSKHRCTAVLFTTIWASAIIVNAKDGYYYEQREDLGRKNVDLNFNLRKDLTRETEHSTLKIVPRILLFEWIVRPFKAIVTHVVSKLAEPFVYENQGNYTCHRNVCFTPENGLGLEVGGPINPQEENTTFIFYDAENRAVVHGLNGSRQSPWVNDLIKALLDKVNCNVLQVDWQERARFPYYAKAASSSPLVGVLLSFMLQKIIETSNCSLHPDNVHVVGFSLGAHAAGVCGRHFYDTTSLLLGRITGLDPAGPLFYHSNVTLSTNDAQFVDVIHTNAGAFKEGKLGINKSIGHVDFYPNGGSEQPNCPDTGDPACSHKRAQALFIQSVYNNCSFKSYYCQGGWSAFLTGQCLKEHNSSYIGEMGYYSFNASGRDNQYLNTTGDPPYCYNNTEIWTSLLNAISAKETTTTADGLSSSESAINEQA
ncbi:lipase member H-like isoform X2 [Haemaphysalis longicornis]